MRLDLLISEREGISRTRAHNLIKTGGVTVLGKQITKPSAEVDSDAPIVITDTIKYASLGGLKLENALLSCGKSVEGTICLDVGAANGGFTDCLLRYGAAEVVATDLTLAFPETFANSPKVRLLDGVNAKDLGNYFEKGSFDFISVDLSFISLTGLFSILGELLKEGGMMMALFKPQFEVGRKYLPKSGVVRDRKAIEKSFQLFLRSASDAGLKFDAFVPVPDIFPDKNEERTVFFLKKSA